jgi:hypothetical protein
MRRRKTEAVPGAKSPKDKSSALMSFSVPGSSGVMAGNCAGL